MCPPPQGKPNAQQQWPHLKLWEQPVPGEELIVSQASPFQGSHLSSPNRNWFLVGLLHCESHTSCSLIICLLCHHFTLTALFMTRKSLHSEVSTSLAGGPKTPWFASLLQTGLHICEAQAMPLLGRRKVILVEKSKRRLPGEALSVILGPWPWLSSRGGRVLMLVPPLTHTWHRKMCSSNKD